MSLEDADLQIIELGKQCEEALPSIPHLILEEIGIGEYVSVLPLEPIRETNSHLIRNEEEEARSSPSIAMQIKGIQVDIKELERVGFITRNFIYFYLKKVLLKNGR